MRQVLRFAVLALVLGSFSSFAEEEVGLVGKWEGKDKDGKVQGIEFKEDHTVILTEDGKPAVPPEIVVKWGIVDGDKGPLDLVMKVGDQEHRALMLLEVKGKNIVIGAPKEDEKRPATMADAKESVEFAKK